ncbi:hypothetical protein GWK47_026235 [Chionoecetes opilio]|uniref:Uncharacterized protein n=1 Tax=Chionoecetes opilio TaxID=41210 RepID=A0A8J8WE16_CHIOP|nr:hypothetical protein GWK47_026235 [Chionoecetes opilio]
MQCVDKEPDFCSCVNMWVNCDCQSGNKNIGNLFHGQQYIRIRNCSQLTVPRGSFKSETLMIIFNDIQNLRLDADSFKMRKNSHINITISNSNLSEIPSGMLGVSRQRPREPILPSRGYKGVVFQVTGSVVGRIAPGVFANHTLHRVTFTNTTIAHIDTGAIDNQLQETISFINNTFVSLGRQAVRLQGNNKISMLVFDGNSFKGNVTQFLEGTIADACILNNKFPRLHTSPWRLRVEGQVMVQGNTFLLLPSHGMDFRIRHRIRLVDNDIRHLGPEAFLLIVPEGENTILLMDGNLIHRMEPRSLCLNDAFIPHYVIIKHVKFQHKCSCNITKTLSQALDIKNLTLETIHSNEVHEQWFKNGECMLKPQGIAYISIVQFLIKSCLHLQNNHLTEILIAMAVIIILIALCVILGWRRMRRTASNVASNVNSLAAGYHSYTEPCPSTTAAGGSMLVVHPEPRTYQETEIHVLFDQAQEIDDDYDVNKDDRSNGRIHDIKRTPSPKTRQSCPVLL